MYKNLPFDKVNISEYEARKTWKLDDSSDSITFHAGANLTGSYRPKKSPRNNSGTSVRAIYDFIKNSHYEGSVYDKIGIVSPSEIDLSTFPEEERSIIYVLKISSQLFGKRVQPGSVEVSTVQEDAELTVVDDGNGNLVQKGTEVVVGNVFYQTGTLVLTRRPDNIFKLPGFTDFPNYTFEEIVFEDPEGNADFPIYDFDVFDLLFRDFDIEFQSVVKNYENEIITTIESDDFGATTNPTAQETPGEPIEVLEDGNFRPFVTTLGFYNDDFELIATGKLSAPIKLTDSKPITILSKFDI